MSYSVYAEYLDEQPGVGRLGRHVHHDSRSLDYLFDASGMSLVTTHHVREIPVLDQGNLGSCTGNASVGALGTDPFYATKPTSLTLDETEAVNIYSIATQLDNYRGTYPPNDTGSNGLAAAKACQKLNLISGYQHITNINDALKALSVTPVITGVNWYDSFDNPDSSGRVAISPGAQVRGGHEFVVDAVDVEQRLVGATNSWGTSWGVNGHFWFSWDDWDRLLHERGDVTVFVPVTAPTPTPTPTPPSPQPTPTPDDVDRQMWTAVQAWAKAKGLK